MAKHVQQIKHQTERNRKINGQTAIPRPQTDRRDRRNRIKNNLWTEHIRITHVILVTTEN